MPGVLRILDANANRAREALRVMEESCRFILEDATLTSALKALRHDLCRAIGAVPGLELSRDTPADVGTGITTENEKQRASVRDTAVAAGKRLSEALRVIEEYAKVLGDHPGHPAQLPGQIEAIRYRAYELERRVIEALAAGAARQWRLCVIITESHCINNDWHAVVHALVSPDRPHRPDCLQLREKSLPDTELLARARELVNLCRPLGVSVIVNDRPDIALLAGADGVHLGQDDLPVAEARRLAGGQLVIGASTANMNQARQAVAQGADYCGVGPMYPTTTKHKPTLAGPGYLRRFTDRYPHTPHLVIGGINAGNLPELTAARARGVAVCAAVCAASDPAAAARRLLAALADAASPAPAPADVAPVAH